MLTHVLGKIRTVKIRAFRKYLVIALAVFVVFSLGVLTGEGKLHFGASHPGVTGLPAQLDYSGVNEIYNALRQNYDGKLSENQVIEGIKHGLATSTNDPYTEYFSPVEAKDFNNQLDGSFSGIGAELGKDADNNLIVVAPIDGSPAAKAGLRSQDIISSINGQSTAGLSVDAAVAKIRGEQGTKVTLVIIRNKSQQFSLSITRAQVQIPTVKWQIISGNIGYMQISQFSDPDTFSLSQQAVAKFQQAHVRGVILDLRDNPGGEVDAAVNVSSLWLPLNTLIMQEKRGSTVVDSSKSTGNDPLHGLPTAVLINAGSASAAEITAAALRDNHQAQVIGEKSFGKGVVQQVIPFQDGSELKVTVASWFRPNGQNINKRGITPDRTVKMTDDDYKNGRDPQKDAAINWLNQRQ